MNLAALLPFLRWFQLINQESLKADMMAGITGAVIVLPQGIAFATIAGLPPEYGLYTAMVTPIVAALFGSSLHLISGPTTAISIIIFTAVSHHAEPGSPEFISLVLTITLMAGVYQTILGLARMGTLTNFISHTVVIGFTAGAAILIVTSQMKNILGIVMPKGESFIDSWLYLWSDIGSTNPYIFSIAIATLVTALVIKWFMPKAPHLLIALIIGSLLALGLSGTTDTIQLVGEVPATLPPLSMPDLSLASIKMLAPEALAVALLGLIEAVSISRTIATKSHQRIDANQEFIGQGLSNIVGSFFSSYAGSGSFTRSGINYSAGAKTPLSAIFAALFLMLIILLVAPLTAYIPEAGMAGIILIVAYKLIDFHHIKQIIKYSKSESAILLTTFFATLFLELEFAIYLGVLLSLIIFLARTSTPEIITLAMDNSEGDRKSLINVRKKPLVECPQLKIIRIDMSIYFGSINHIQNRIHQIVDEEHIHHILIVGSSINFIDLSGKEMLLIEARRLEALGGGLYFSELKSYIYKTFIKSRFSYKIGTIHFFDKKRDAITGIYKKLDKDVCAECKARVFNECDR